MIRLRVTAFAAGRCQAASRSAPICLLGAQGRRPLSEQRLQLLLQRAYSREGGIPPPLELAGDKTIVRIDSVILSSRPGCFVPRLLERQLGLALFLARLVLAFRDRVDRRFNTERLQQPHDLGSHRLVDPQSAERDTGISAGVAPGRVAIIAAAVPLRAVVADEQPASAMAAAQEAGEQSFPLAHRAAYHHAFAVSIVGDQPLIPFIVWPRQITLVMVDEQDRPV